MAVDSVENGLGKLWEILRDLERPREASPPVSVTHPPLEHAAKRSPAVRITALRVTFFRIPENSYQLRISSIFTVGPWQAFGQLRRAGRCSMPHHPAHHQLKHLGSGSSTTHCNHHDSINLIPRTLIPLLYLYQNYTHTNRQYGSSILHRRQLQDVCGLQSSNCRALKADQTTGTAPSSPSRRLSRT